MLGYNLIVKINAMNLFNIFLVTIAHSHDVDFLEISPSFSEIVKFTGESHIVICDGKYKMVHWLNPRNRVVQMRNEDQKVFTEEKNGTLALVFTSIDKSDKGNWTCMLKGSDLRKSFKIYVNGNKFFFKSKSESSINNL